MVDSFIDQKFQGAFNDRGFALIKYIATFC